MITYLKRLRLKKKIRLKNKKQILIRTKETKNLSCAKETKIIPLLLDLSI